MRKIAQEKVQLLLRLIQETAAGPFDQGKVGWLASLILVMLEHHRSQVHGGEHVPATRGQRLLLFQISAERQHGNVRGQGKRGAEPVDVLKEARSSVLARDARETCQRQTQ